MRLQIHTGKASRAFSDIERLARVAERQGRVHRLIRLHILAALAKNAYEGKQSAHTHLAKAVRTGWWLHPDVL
jgi:MalT-like TPR region